MSRCILPGTDAAGGQRSYVTATGERLEILFSAETIDARVHQLAWEIAAADFRSLLVVPILTGSFIFAADLIRALQTADLAPEIDFLSLGSYGAGTESGGQVEVLRDLEVDPSGRDLLLVDDILDTGRTLAFARDLMAARRARRVAACVLLDKKIPRAVQVEAEFSGFDCPDAFVVGYGMDLGHRFRELPFIGRIV